MLFSKGRLKKTTAILLSALMVISIMPEVMFKASAAGDGIKTTLNIGNGNIIIGNGTVDGYDSNKNHVTVTDPDGYIVTGTTTANAVSVTAGTQNITLQNASIQVPRGLAAFSIASGASVNLSLSGINILNSYEYAGLRVTAGASLTITGTDADELRATGGFAYGNGIGGDYDSQASGTITIAGGTITATGHNIAGIGSSNNGVCGTINISGGTVNASVTGYGTGIGGYNGNLYISGGTINACGASGWADIDIAPTAVTYITGGSIKSKLANVGGDGSHELGMVIIALPKAAASKAVSALTVMQGGSKISYGIHDVKTDSDGKLYIYLPGSYPDGIATTASVTVGGVTYSGYYGTVVRGQTQNWLKKDQSALNINVPGSYTYGSEISPIVSGGSAYGTPSFLYSGKDSITNTDYSGSVPPTDIGSYSVKATLSGGEIYYDKSSETKNFTITPKNINNAENINITDQVYTGSAAIPTVTVKDGDRVLVQGTDFDVSCPDKNVGTATATISGKGNYTGTITRSFNITPKEMALTFSASPVGTAYAGNNVTLTARFSGAVNLPLGTVTFKCGDTEIKKDATISKSGEDYTATAIWSGKFGSYSFSAAYTPAENDNYSCSTTGTITGYNIEKNEQTGFSFKDADNNVISGVTKTYGDSLTVYAYGDQSTGIVTYAVTSGQDVVSYDETTGKFTIKKAGTATITATSPANDYYNPSAATLTVTVSRAAQAGFAFKDSYGKSISNVTRTYGDSLTVSASGDQNTGTVTYAVTDGNDVASVDASTGVVTLLKSGSATITATNPLNEFYFQAAATLTITVNCAAQTGFAFKDDEGKAISNVTRTYGDSLTVFASGDQNTGAVTYAVTDGNDVASVDASTGVVTLLKSGSATITATSPQNDRYSKVTASLIITVSHAEQTGFAFKDAEGKAISNVTRTYGDSLTVSASGDQNTGAVTYAVTDGNDVVSVDASTGAVTLLKSGSATITATSPQNDRYNKVTASLIIMVNRAGQAGFSVKNGTNYSVTGGTITMAEKDGGFTLKMTGNQSKKSVEFSVSSGTDVLSVDQDGNVTIIKAGTATITVISPEDDQYNAATVTINIDILSSDASLKGLSVGSQKAILKEGVYYCDMSYATATAKITVVTTGGHSTWKLFSDSECTTEITDQAMTLKVGDNTAYLKVTAQDGETAKLYTVKVKRQPYIAPREDLTITGTTKISDDGTQITTASIIPEQTNTSGVENDIIKLDKITITAPSSVFQNILGTGLSLSITNSSALGSTNAALKEPLKKAGITPVAVIELNLFRINKNGSTEAVHGLSGTVTVTIALTEEQLALIAANGEKADIYYYNSDTDTFIKMNAVFDLVKKTATFTTDHFSTFVLAYSDASVTVTGISYTSHVQNIGWQKAVTDGQTAGTTGRSLRIEALQISLTGNVPQGAKIIYSAHIQKVGWQKAVSNGAIAGTSGKRLRVEAIRITLDGMTGYEVQYRTHVQSLGWMPWQTSVNGTDIKDAGIAGTTGKSLRVEAIEIRIVKIGG